MSIFKSNKQAKISEDINIGDEREQLKRERNELGHQKQMLSLEKEYLEKKYNLVIQSAQDTAENEHTYHKSTAEKEAALLVLDERIAAKKESITLQEELAGYKNTVLRYTEVIKEKDAMIARLDEYIKVLITKLPSVDLSKLNINVDSSK